MNNLQNADSKQIAGTYGAFSAKVETFNLNGHQFTGVVLSNETVSYFPSPCAWVTYTLVYSKEEGVLVRLKVYHKRDASGCIDKIEDYTVVAFGDLTFNDEIA